MSIFEEIVKLTKEDVGSSPFQVYITVGVAYNMNDSTLYVPILDALNGPPSHTVILAFDTMFEKEITMKSTCENVTNYFTNKLNIPMTLDFDDDSEYKTNVRKADVLINDTENHPRIKTWFNNSLISVYFYPWDYLPIIFEISRMKLIEYSIFKKRIQTYMIML
jgi:hypothetical protein